MQIAKKNPEAGGLGARNADLAGWLITSEGTKSAAKNQAKSALPSRAVLARRWPKLRAFIGEGGR